MRAESGGTHRSKAEEDRKAHLWFAWGSSWAMGEIKIEKGLVNCIDIRVRDGECRRSAAGISLCLSVVAFRGRNFTHGTFVVALAPVGVRLRHEDLHRIGGFSRDGRIR